MFNTTMGKGFHLKFANGWTVSVQFGPGNYCDNRHMNFNQNVQAGEKGSNTAEIAAWDKHGKYYQFENDTVDGYKNADDVAKFINEIASIPVDTI